MAHFTDQFTRHDPWKFRPSLLIPTWPTILLQDARALLSGVNADALAEIAEEIEKELQELSKPYNFPADRDHWIWTRVRPGLAYESTTKTSDSIRKGFGDLNLFLALHSPMSFQQASRLSFIVEDWELLAVLAIWKLIDAHDVFWNNVKEMRTRPSQPEGIDFVGLSAALAMEAQAAVAHATQLKERASHLDELERAMRSAQQMKLSRKGTDTVLARHKKLDGARLAAFALVDEKQFDSQSAGADAISNNIEISPGKFVPYLTAYRWLLKREDWEKKISARSQ